MYISLIELCTRGYDSTLTPIKDYGARLAFSLIISVIYPECKINIFVDTRYKSLVLTI